MNDHRQIGIFQFTEHPFERNSQSIRNNIHEVKFSVKFLRIQPQFKKNLKIKNYDLFYIVIKNRNEKNL